MEVLEDWSKILKFLLDASFWVKRECRSVLSGSQKQHLYPGSIAAARVRLAPSDKVDVCLLPAGPFSGAALVGQGAQANSLHSSFFSS